MMNIPSRRSGFTMIELLVAMAIGMIIMLAVGALFISSRKNSSAQQGFARVQENGRFAVEALSSYARNAGVRATILSNTAAVFPSATPFSGVTFSSKAVITGTEGGASNDQFSVRQEGTTARPVMDCNGSLVPGASDTSPMILSLRFYVASNKLLCDSSKSGTAQVIADNLVDMQLMYAQDAKNTFDGYPTRYVKASNVTSSSTWDRVVALRYCLTIASADTNAVLTPQTYDSCSSTLDQAPVSVTASDRRLYKNFIILVNLRNAGAD